VAYTSFLANASQIASRVFSVAQTAASRLHFLIPSFSFFQPCFLDIFVHTSIKICYQVPEQMHTIIGTQ
jgi:hypothetical protein